MEHRRHLQRRRTPAPTRPPRSSRTASSTRTGRTRDRGAGARLLGRPQNEQIGPADAQSRVDPSHQRHRLQPALLTRTARPCDTGFVDVKLTENDAPPFFTFVGNNDYKAHARIQALRLRSSNNLLPIAAEDPTPRAARAIFVDESTGDTSGRGPAEAERSTGRARDLGQLAGPGARADHRSARGRPDRAQRFHLDDLRQLPRRLLRHRRPEPGTPPRPGLVRGGNRHPEPAERAPESPARPQRLARQGHLRRPLLLLRHRDLQGRRTGASRLRERPHEGGRQALRECRGDEVPHDL